MLGSSVFEVVWHSVTFKLLTYFYLRADRRQQPEPFGGGEGGGKHTQTTLKAAHESLALHGFRVRTAGHTGGQVTVEGRYVVDRA